MTPDPHAHDYCVVCGVNPTVEGEIMYPVNGIENGCVCGDCVNVGPRAE